MQYMCIVCDQNEPYLHTMAICRTGPVYISESEKVDMLTLFTCSDAGPKWRVINTCVP